MLPFLGGGKIQVCFYFFSCLLTLSIHPSCGYLCISLCHKDTNIVFNCYLSNTPFGQTGVSPSSDYPSGLITFQDLGADFLYPTLCDPFLQTVTEYNVYAMPEFLSRAVIYGEIRHQLKVLEEASYLLAFFCLFCMSREGYMGRVNLCVTDTNVKKGQ